MEDNNIYGLEFDINGAKALRSSIQYMIEMWPGSPARPVEEQTFLWHIREQLDRCILEHTFNMESK